MSGASIDPRTAVLCAGALYIFMPLTVWAVLHRRYDGKALALWCGGGMLLGLSYLLYGVRDAAPAWVSVSLANGLAYASYGLRIGALRRQLGLGARLGWSVACVVAAWGCVHLAWLHSVAWRFGVNLLLLAASAGWLWLLSWRVARVTDGRSARLIGWAYALFSAALLVRLAFLVSGRSGTVFMANGGDFVILLVGAFVANIVSHIGYLGMAFEALHAQESRQALSLAQAQAQRGVAEQQAQALRERLAEREEFVRVLAHEVRQPLNNASAALQGAQNALNEHAVDEAPAAGHVAAGRVGRAQAVIRHIVESLDNTLAATTLLSSGERIALRDADVSTLIQLSLGDLDAGQRARVRVQRLSQTRTASMDIGLLRLALRNLLGNALKYSPPGSPVVLRVSDSDDPLALIFEVIDKGPGVASELAPRVFERGVRGAHGQPGHGLGLYVVQRVMALHGGTAALAPPHGTGAVFRLVLRQDGP